MPTLISLNLLKLRAQARSKAGVPSTDYSNSLLDDQLNIAYVQLAMLLANLGEDYFEEQKTKFNLVGNSSLYSLPTDFMALKQLRLAYTAPTNPEDYRVATSYDATEVHDISIDEENVPTTNPIVDLTNNYMRIKPTPTSDVTNGGELYYIAMPSALAATGDVPVIPVMYHDKLAVYGAKEIAFKYEKWNKHERLAAEWNTLMQDLEQKIADRDRNKPVRFKSPFEVGRADNIRRRELPN